MLVLTMGHIGVSQFDQVFPRPDKNLGGGKFPQNKSQK